MQIQFEIEKVFTEDQKITMIISTENYIKTSIIAQVNPNNDKEQARGKKGQKLKWSPSPEATYD